jgi:hypothetical protein
MVTEVPRPRATPAQAGTGGVPRQSVLMQSKLAVQRPTHFTEAPIMEMLSPIMPVSPIAPVAIAPVVTIIAVIPVISTVPIMIVVAVAVVMVVMTVVVIVVAVVVFVIAPGRSGGLGRNAFELRLYRLDECQLFGGQPLCTTIGQGWPSVADDIAERARGDEAGTRAASLSALAFQQRGEARQ